MTRIVYMGGEPMKYKCVIVVALSVFACFGGITTNSPLSLLRKEWGKGSIVDFRKVAYENLVIHNIGHGTKEDAYLMCNKVEGHFRCR